MLRIYIQKKFLKDITLLVSFLFLSLFVLNLSLDTKANLNLVKIRNCYDGDTCTTENGEKIRLACIDAPEIRGEISNPKAAKDAREFLNQQVKNKYVLIKRLKKDRFGRTVAEISIKGTNIQKLLVENNHAKIYQKYANQCTWTNHL
tara:strand:+ start:328 stop:768 length:441 start_codon:yes stop_codon:yes gene_type:complete